MSIDMNAVIERAEASIKKLQAETSKARESLKARDGDDMSGTKDAFTQCEHNDLPSVKRAFFGTRPRVIIESPYAGDVARNKRYLAACVRDSLMRGEAPFASHGFYTQYLDDTEPAERNLGMECGFAWAQGATKRVFYTDLGESGGMYLARGVDDLPTEDRTIGTHWEQTLGEAQADTRRELALAIGETLLTVADATRDARKRLKRLLPTGPTRIIQRMWKKIWR